MSRSVVVSQLRTMRCSPSARSGEAKMLMISPAWISLVSVMVAYPSLDTTIVAHWPNASGLNKKYRMRWCFPKGLYCWDSPNFRILGCSSSPEREVGSTFGVCSFTEDAATNSDFDRCAFKTSVGGGTLHQYIHWKVAIISLLHFKEKWTVKLWQSKVCKVV